MSDWQYLNLEDAQLRVPQPALPALLPFLQPCCTWGSPAQSSGTSLGLSKLLQDNWIAALVLFNRKTRWLIWRAAVSLLQKEYMKSTKGQERSSAATHSAATPSAPFSTQCCVVSALLVKQVTVSKPADATKEWKAEQPRQLPLC